MSDDFDLESSSPDSGFDLGSATPAGSGKTGMAALEELQPTAPPSQPTLNEGNPLTGAMGTAVGMGQNLGASLMGNIYGLAKRLGGSSMKDAEDAAHGLISKWARQPSTETEKNYTETLGKTLGSLPPNLGDFIPPVLVSGAKAQVAGKLEDLSTRVKKPVVLTPEETLKNEVARQAIDAGYVIPPSQSVKPTLGGKAREALSGKIQTAQKFSEHNQTNTIKLIKQDLGLREDVAITPEVLGEIRGKAGEAYEALKNVPGMFKTNPRFDSSVNAIAKRLFDGKDELPGLFNTESKELTGLFETLRKKEFSPQSAVAAIKKLREDSKGNLKALGDNEKNQLGYAQKAAADAIEKMVDSNLSSSVTRAEIYKNLRKQGITDVDPNVLLKNFRDARKTIAKTYSVEDALGPNGSIYAEKLGTQLGKGKPLSGNLKKAAEFSRTYPKVNQRVERIGSQPGWSPLDVYGSVTGASSGMYLGHHVGGAPGALIGGALGAAGPIIRPFVRSGMMKPRFQNKIPVQDMWMPPERSSAMGALGRVPGMLPEPSRVPMLGALSKVGAPYRKPALMQAQEED